MKESLKGELPWFRKDIFNTEINDHDRLTKGQAI